MTKKFYRHWDLLIEKIDTEMTDDWLSIQSDNILLEWEATNHFHRLLWEWIKTYRKKTIELWDSFYAGWFNLMNGWKLVHEEHETITLEPWTYKFYVQREYDPVEERRVID